jgi:hypothetical protein
MISADKQRTLLILLDRSAAFDTLDICTLLSRLEFTFGITGTALKWLRIYMNERSQFIGICTEQPAVMLCEFDVAPGSVVRPLLFTLYVAAVAKVIHL